MASVVVCGDSQSVFAGSAAGAVLSAQGHRVWRVSHPGKGPHDYVRLKPLWSEYVTTVRSSGAAVVVLIFGSNDPPNGALEEALSKLKRGVRPKVLLSGPPLYPGAEQQARGEAIRSIYQRVFGEDFFDAYAHTPLEIPRDAAGLHLTRAGATPWGEAIANEVERRLARATAS